MCAPAALLALLLASCVPRSAAPSPAPRAALPVSTDISKLGRAIALPRRPLQAVWQQEQIGDGSMGPSDTRLTAVMLFSAADLKRIAHAPSIEAAPPHSEAQVEPWFPAALQKKAAPNVGGKRTLRCARLVPDAFFKSSLIHGDLLQPEGTNYLILSLYTT